MPLVLGKDAVYEVRPAPKVEKGIAFQAANIAPAGAEVPFKAGTSSARPELSKAIPESPTTTRNELLALGKEFFGFLIL